jgi:hypothetical protein
MESEFGSEMIRHIQNQRKTHGDGNGVDDFLNHLGVRHSSYSTVSTDIGWYSFQCLSKKGEGIKL